MVCDEWHSGLNSDLKLVTAREQTKSESLRYLARPDIHPKPLNMSLLDNDMQTYVQSAINFCNCWLVL